jgi:hypothetical protein
MEKLVEKNNIIFYQLEENQPKVMYEIPKELGIGREDTIGEKTVIKLTSNDINKLAKVLQENDINGDTLKDMCEQFHWHMLDNLPERGEKEFFFAAEYK